jgi:hypothetical protein
MPPKAIGGRMSEYKPDRWVILKITNGDKAAYKVMGGWYGGYLGSDSWRINSGISKIELVDNTYKFHGNSGSVYVCHKDGYGVTVLMSSVIPDDDRLEVLPESDFTLLNLEVDSE